MESYFKNELNTALQIRINRINNAIQLLEAPTESIS